MVDRALRFDLLGRDVSLGRTLSQGEGRLSRFSKATGRLAVVGGAAFAGLGAAAGLMGVRTLAGLEQAEVGFAQLLGSGRKAQKFIGQLKRFAATTPFELPGLIEAARGLLGAGKAAKDVIPSLRAWGDAAGALGLNQEAFGRVMLAVTQIMNKGKVSAEELLQITEAGIPIYPLLARALHKPVPEIQKLGEQGKLLSKDVLPALEQQMAKDYGGSMAKQSHTLSGLWSTLMDTINVGLADVLKPLEPLMKTALTSAIGTLGAAFQGLPDLVRPAGRAVGRVADALGRARDILKVLGPKAALKSLFPTDLAPVIDAIATAVGKVADRLTTAGKAWATRIIDGLTQGLRTGNYGPLGKALGDAVAKALRATAGLAGLLTAWFASVDWFTVGKAVGGHAVGFALGFVSALGADLVKTFRQHPWEATFAVLSLIPVGRAAGIISKVLGRLPILGPLLRVLEGAGRLVERPVFAVVGTIGRAFAEGFAKVFPGVRGGLRRVLVGLDTELRGRVLYFLARGKDLVVGLARGIGATVGLVVRAAGRVVALLTSPFRAAGGWLVRRGVEAVAGFGRGIAAMLGSVGRWAGMVVTRVTSPFRAAGGWLYNAGRSLLSGLAAGIRAGLAGIGALLSQIKNAIVGGLQRLFHMGSPSKVMAELGRHIVGGLVKGIVTSQAGLRAAVKMIGGNALDWLGGALGGIGGALARGPVAGIVRGVAAGRGWGWGAQWAALSQLISHESGWRPTAQNPTSSAYGLFQFLDPTWGSVGGHKTANPFLQAVYGLRYIAGRYGNPVNAWAFWRAHHWYGDGGIFTRPSIIGVGERGPEAVVPLDRIGAGGIDYDRLAEAVVRALRREPPVVRFADAHRAGLSYRRGLGGVKLGFDT